MHVFENRKCQNNLLISHVGPVQPVAQVHVKSCAGANVGNVLIRVLANGWFVVERAGILGFPIELIPRTPLARSSPVSDVDGSCGMVCFY